MGPLRGATPLLALIGLVLTGGPICAQDRDKPEAKTNQIRIEYVAPKDKRLAALHARLRQRRLLEKFQESFSPLRLPAPLLLRLQDCDGEANAWYKGQVVTVCYEYLADVVRNAPRRTTPGGVTRRDAIAGPAIEVFLHEIGRAIFDMLDIPVLGRAEDAADHFAAYILLDLGRIATKQDARRAVGGTALMYLSDAQKELRDAKTQRKGMTTFAGRHELAAQRLYNLVCMAYGAYPEVFERAVKRGRLPKARARRCAAEYRQVAYAMKTLIAPHLDPVLRQELQGRHWFRPASR